MARLAHRAAPSMRIIHPVDARAPEECVFALPHHLAYRNRARIVGYQDWYTRRDATGDYAYLRQQLQILQWQQPRTRWILKSPFHLWHLDALLRVFPTPPSCGRTGMWRPCWPPGAACPRSSCGCTTGGST